MSQTMKEKTVYQFKLSEEKSVNLRRMSEVERDEIFESIQWLFNGLQKALEDFDRERYVKFARDIYGLVRSLCPDKSHEALESCMVFATRFVWLNVLARIINVETALRDGRPIPGEEAAELTEEQLEVVTGEELEREGEESPAG